MTRRIERTAISRIPAGRAVGAHHAQLHQLLPDRLAGPRLEGEVVVERPAQDHRGQRALAVAGERVAGVQHDQRAGADDRAGPRRPPARGGCRAWDPWKGQRIPVRSRSSDPASAATARKLSVAGIIPACGAGCRHRHGLELVASRGVRLRARTRRGGASWTRSARRSGSAPGWARTPRTATEASLRPDRVELALHTAAVYSAFCRATGVDQIEALATSAIRDAANGEELLADIERTTGLHARVISGEEEARYGWLAIANSTTIEDGFGHRHRRRQHPDAPDRGPHAGRLRLAPARRRARERALPPRREGRREADEGAPRPRGRQARGARLVERRRPARGHRRDDPQPRRRGDEASSTSPTSTSRASCSRATRSRS